MSLTTCLKSSTNPEAGGHNGAVTIGRTKGGTNTKLHAVCDSQGRLINMIVTAGQVSDYIGARALLGGLSKVDGLLGDCGYDADWFREALRDKGIEIGGAKVGHGSGGIIRPRAE